MGTITRREKEDQINLDAIFAGKNYKSIKENGQEWYQNEFFKKCDIKTGKYIAKGFMASYKCGGKELKADLTQCVKNASGRFIPGVNFQKTSKGCKIEKNWLKCKAMEPAGRWHDAKMNLNFVLYLLNGKLTCNIKKPWIKKKKF